MPPHQHDPTPLRATPEPVQISDFINVYAHSRRCLAEGYSRAGVFTCTCGTMVIGKREVFVFGSNLAGRHGAGSALHAKKHFHAASGVGVGRTGFAYAIPTKDKELNPLPLKEIKRYVDMFIDYADEHREFHFIVVKIGCGLAGFTEDQIRPMFANAPTNCELPDGWRTK